MAVKFRFFRRSHLLQAPSAKKHTKNVRNWSIKTTRKNVIRRQVKLLSILILINWRIYQVTQPYMHSTIFVLLSRHLHNNCIPGQTIIRTFFLIRQIQRIHITQKDLAFISHVVLHWVTIRKSKSIFSRRRFPGSDTDDISSCVSPPSTTGALTAPSSEEYAPLGSFTAFSLITLHSLALFWSE